MAGMTTSGGERVTSLPTRRIIAAIVGGGVVAAILCSGATLLMAQVRGALLACWIGAAMVTLIALASVLVIGPWKQRTISWWATAWLGSTVIRLLFTPVAAYLVYSAAPLPGQPLLLAVVASYVIVLGAETLVVAAHMKRIA